MIDHEALLIRYIAWVLECEGVDFITCGCGYHKEDYFSPEQWAELERLAPMAQELYMPTEPEPDWGGERVVG